MTNYVEYIERKIKEVTAKRDAVVLPPIVEPTPEYYSEIQVWWYYESQRIAYQDCWVQYKLKASECALDKRKRSCPEIVSVVSTSDVPEKPSGAICGGRHHFKTKAEAVKHAHKDFEACIDCWTGIPWTIDNPKPKRKVK